MKAAILSMLAVGAAPALAQSGFSFWSSSLTKRATTDPGVLYPHLGTVWSVGSIHNVTWNTSGIAPPTCGAIVNTAIYLAEMGALAENSTPITQNFSLSLGHIEIQAPNVTNGSNYQIVLKADTSDASDEGTFSPAFVIYAAPNVTTAA